MLANHKAFFQKRKTKNSHNPLTTYMDRESRPKAQTNLDEISHDFAYTKGRRYCDISISGTFMTSRIFRQAGDLN